MERRNDHLKEKLSMMTERDSTVGVLDDEGMEQLLDPECETCETSATPSGA